MPKFSIKYECPNSEGNPELVTEEVEFEDWTGRAEQNGKSVGPLITITAHEWAMDYAYGQADKG